MAPGTGAPTYPPKIFCAKGYSNVVRLVCLYFL